MSHEQAKSKVLQQVELMRKKYEEQQRAAEIELGVLGALPEETPVTKVSVHSWPADASLELEPVASIAEVEPLMRLLPPIPMLRVHDGCLSFVPASWVEARPEKYERAQIEEIAPFILKHEVWGFQPDDREVSWYTKVGDRTVKVKVALTDMRICSCAIVNERDDRNRKTGKITQYPRLANRDAEHVRYASESDDHAHIVWYWSVESLTWGDLEWLPEPVNR